jgi:hypothetical protein
VKLYILGHSITVTSVKQLLLGSENMGECESFKGTIRVRDDLEPSVYHSTVLHEVIHMIDKYLDLDLNEHQISCLGEALFATLRDNPEFLKRMGK